jgi:hypothetical protein
MGPGFDISRDTQPVGEADWLRVLRVLLEFGRAVSAPAVAGG